VNPTAPGGGPAAAAPAAQGSGDRFATLVLLFSASLWGLAWWPMQQLAARGVQGPALSLLAYGGVGLLGVPLLWRERARWRGEARYLAAIALVGGWGAASFVWAMSQGDVVREMLLFYLAPAWSVLGGRLFLKERLGARRAAAVALAMAGAALVIRGGAPGSGVGGSGGVTMADLMALSSSITFAGNNLITRAASAIPVASKAVALMLGCALISAAFLVGAGLGVPELPGPVALGVMAFAVIWIVGGSSTTAYGVSHLDAGRSAIIILAELVAAVVSASLIKDRVPTMPEIIGGSLILLAAALEVLQS
jgi:drug/metabolite transporter (DMT)-like permease